MANKKDKTPDEYITVLAEQDWQRIKARTSQLKETVGAMEFAAKAKNLKELKVQYQQLMFYYKEIQVSIERIEEYL